MRKTIMVVGCIIIGIAMILGAVKPVQAGEGRANEVYEQVSDPVDGLYQRRSMLLLQLAEEQSEIQSAVIKNEISKVDEELRRLGMRPLNQKEVETFFRNHHETIKNGQIRDVVVPDTQFNDWTMSQFNQQGANGEWFTVTRLMVSPNPNYLSYSYLYYNNQVTCYYSNSWTAGSTNIISGVAYGEAMLDTLQSTNKTIYEAVHSSIPAITASTQVKIPQITFSQFGSLTASFIYVRPINASSTDDALMMASTKAATRITYSTSTIQYKNSSGAWVSSGKSVNGNKQYYSYYPAYYNNATYAINCYQSISLVERVYNVCLLYVYDPNGTDQITRAVLDPAYPIEVETGISF